MLNQTLFLVLFAGGTSPLFSSLFSPAFYLDHVDKQKKTCHPLSFCCCCPQLDDHDLSLDSCWQRKKTKKRAKKNHSIKVWLKVQTLSIHPSIPGLNILIFLTKDYIFHEQFAAAYSSFNPSMRLYFYKVYTANGNG